MPLLNQEYLDKDFLLFLYDALQNPQQIDNTVYSRGSISINQRPCAISTATLLNAFLPNGEKNTEVCKKNGISFDEKRFSIATLTKNYGLDQNKITTLSFRERMIFEAAIFTAGTHVFNKYRSQINLEIGEEIQSLQEKVLESQKNILSQSEDFHIEELENDLGEKISQPVQKSSQDLPKRKFTRNTDEVLQNLLADLKRENEQYERENNRIFKEIETANASSYRLIAPPNVKENLSLLTKEADQCKKSFLVALRNYLFNDSEGELLCDAVNTLESIKNPTPNQGPCTHSTQQTNCSHFNNIDELKNILDQVDNGQTKGIYTNTTEDRMELQLDAAGFSQKEIDAFKKSEQLEYDAIIATLQSKALTNYLETVTKMVHSDSQNDYIYSNDRRTLEYQLLLLVNPEIKLHQACKRLEAAIKKTENNVLSSPGQAVLDKAKKAVLNNHVPSEDMALLTQSVHETAAIIEEPSSKNIDRLAQTTQKINNIDREWGKMMGGVLGSFLGSVIVLSALTVTAGAITALTMGAGLPLSALLIAIGISITSASLVGAPLTYKAGLFAHHKRKGSIAIAEEDFLETAKKELPEQPKKKQKKT